MARPVDPRPPLLGEARSQRLEADVASLTARLATLELHVYGGGVRPRAAVPPASWPDTLPDVFPASPEVVS